MDVEVVFGPVNDDSLHLLPFPWGVASLSDGADDVNGRGQRVSSTHTSAAAKPI